MTNKKVRVWLIFFVKLLPLVLLIGFMLYFFRHELPESLDQVSGTSIQYIYYNEDEFLELDQTDLTNFKFNVDGKILNSNGNLTNNIIDWTWNLTYSAHSIFYIRNFGTTYHFATSNDLLVFRCDYLNYCMNVYSISSDVTSYTFKYVQDFWIKDVIVRDVYDYDHTNYFDNIVKQFDDFTTSNFNFIDSLNFNDFYDFTVEHLVHNPSPIYHSVFNIMIYEIIVDLMLLLFGAFAFVINWSRKWLEGIYEKW